MKVEVHPNKAELGSAAAASGAKLLAEAIAKYGEANVIVATGASQFDTLNALIGAEVDWSKVSFYHLDEYVGISDSHPASFRRYLRERFLEKLPAYKDFLPVEGDAEDLDNEVARLNAALNGVRIDVCFAGIGENGHLAFNDPPADFDYALPYLLVDLDEACRQQQFGEGWFETLDAVPTRAITMSINTIMASRSIILSVPDERKAAAAKATIEGPVTRDVPASIVQQHADATVYLDKASASQLLPKAT